MLNIGTINKKQATTYETFMQVVDRRLRTISGGMITSHLDMGDGPTRDLYDQGATVDKVIKALAKANDIPNPFKAVV